RVLVGDGHYVKHDDYWWSQDPIHQFGDDKAFFRLLRETRADGAETVFGYDAYLLVMTTVTTPLGVVSAAEIDYHVLTPWRIHDPNGNTAEIRYDELGFVIAATTIGKTMRSDGTSEPYGGDPI